MQIARIADADCSTRPVTRTVERNRAGSRRLHGLQQDSTTAGIYERAPVADLMWLSVS